MLLVKGILLNLLNISKQPQILSLWPRRYVTLSLYLRLSSLSGNFVYSIDAFAYQPSGASVASVFASVFFYNSTSDYLIALSPLSARHSASTLRSSERFFYTFWWSEREASELFGVFFEAKEDSRNLLLDYTWTLSPLLRTFPSVGLLEVYFDSFLGRLLHQPLSVQI